MTPLTSLATDFTRPQRLTVRCAGRELVVERGGDLESLWDAMGDDDFGEDERIPYWTELWPASIALADWLAEQAAGIRGKSCLDLGCGLGLTAIAGSLLGARVLAMDYAPEALAWARRNAQLNGAPQPLWSLMDWRAPGIRQGAVDVVWAADIFYETRFFPVLRDLFLHVLAPGGRIWIGEAERSVSREVWDWLAAEGFSTRLLRTCRVTLEGVTSSVNVRELTRKG